jgi:sodium-dependent phosphate transporter
MFLASILEFAGAVGVGNRVAETIRTRVVDLDRYQETPAVLMLGMACAITASSLYLTVCTKIGLPVSTTHTIMGGIIGMGVATVGTDGVIWADFSNGINGGVAQVFLGWIIAPAIAGALGAITFLITKYAVMIRHSPVLKGLISVPLYAGVTGALIVMLLVWKGGSISPDLNGAELAGVIVGGGAAVSALVAIFFVPWLYRLIVKDDWQLRWYHIIQGPLLLRRPEPPVQPEGYSGGIRDFYEGHLDKEALAAVRAERAERTHEAADRGEPLAVDAERAETSGSDSDSGKKPGSDGKAGFVGPKPEGPFYSRPVLFWYFKWFFLRGVDQDIVGQQSRKSRLAKNIEDVHAHGQHFENKAEYLYSFLQVMTASAMSFAHGANDVANAVGPLATIYEIWRTNKADGSSPVPIWILVFGGAALAIGCWTYGYHIMRNLGNRLTLHSPSRGFSMELGTVCTVIIATQLRKYSGFSVPMNSY